MKLGIISDIHEDIIRLKEALHLLDSQGCNEVACLGDIVGFVIPSLGFIESRNAAACLQMVQTNCKYVVAGNHDLYAAGKIPDFPADFNYPRDWYEKDYPERKKMAENRVWLNEEIELDPLISEEDRKYLATLPEYLVACENGRKILLSHYLFPDLSGSSIQYYEDFGPVHEHLDFIGQNNCRLGFSGHKHAEAVFLADRKGMNRKTFGEVRLMDDLQWIVGPCIANGKKENGCLVLDTEKWELSVIPLNTKPRIMMTVEYNEPKDEE